MKLSEGVEWGVHCAVVLAGLAPGATLPGKALAEYHGVSESYLLKHLKALTAAELLVSVPGPRGGYRLARPPQRITLLDVVQAIDGTQPAFRCTEIHDAGRWRSTPAPIDGPASSTPRCCAPKARGGRSWNAPRSPTL